MLKLEILVFEFRTIDGLATGTVVVGKVATLTHEIGYDTVER